jgi:hypothetical protein
MWKKAVRSISQIPGTKRNLTGLNRAVTTLTEVYEICKLSKKYCFFTDKSTSSISAELPTTFLIR